MEIKVVVLLIAVYEKAIHSGSTEEKIINGRTTISVTKQAKEMAMGLSKDKGDK